MATIKLPKGLKHGSYLEIPIEDVSPNNWNPMEMTDESFEMLEKNITKVGFLDPILVVPVGKEGKTIKWMVIDGEHRYEAQKGNVATIPAIVCDPELFDEVTSKIETVRMNKIKGGFNISKFNSLVNDLVKNHEIPFDSIAEELGFVDEDEFQQLIDESRKMLPKQAIKEFDRSVRKIESIDQLHKLVERLWMRFGDTLGANFMILDYGGKRNLWVQIQKSSYIKLIVEKFRDCLSEQCTVDSFLVALLSSVDVPQFIKENKDIITKIPAGAEDTVDILLEDEGEPNDE